MSLQVWIPGTENLNNQGLSSSVITQGGTYISSGGKIGKGCINTSNMIINYGPGKAANQTSVTFWHKWNGSVPTGWITTFQFPYNSGQKRYYLASNESHFHPAFASRGGNTKFTLDSNWHHIALVGTDSKLIVYIDGIEDCTISGNTFTLEGNASFTSCYLNDIRIYDHSLSPNEIHEIAKGLILHYPMNDQYVENIVYDCSGYCNNGTVIGSLQVVDDSPRYKKSTKMNKGQISCLNPISNNIHTVSFWMKTLDWTPSDNNYYVISAGNGWLIYRDHGGSCYYTLCVPSESSSIYKPIPITNKTEWNHICTVSTGSQSKIYINGTLMSVDSVSLKNWGVNRFIIGPGYDDCILSDVRLYSTALSDEDIKELYNTSAIINNNNTLQAYEFVE